MCGLLSAAPKPLFGQAETPLQTKTPLVSDLANENLAIRNRAEERTVAYLMASGKSVTEWLAEQPASPLSRSAEFQHRLTRIRFLVAEARQIEMIQATKVDLSQVTSGKQYLNQLTVQANARLLLDLPDSERPSLRIPELNGSSEFWPSLIQFCQLNELSFAPKESKLRLAKTNQADSQDPSFHFTNHKGPVWLGLIRPAGGIEAFYQIRIQLLWEPKLNVINVQFPLAKLKIENADKTSWGTFNPEATLNVPVREQATGIQFRLPVRFESAQGFESAQHDVANKLTPPPNLITLPYRLVLLARPAKAKFENIIQVEAPALVYRSGMATISLERRQIQDGWLRIQVLTEYDPQRMAQRIQSHDTWSQHCHASLVSVDGTVLQPTRQQQVRQSAYQHLMEYEFDLPEKIRQNMLEQQWALEFETPSGMIELEDTITLRQGK